MCDRKMDRVVCVNEVKSMCESVFLSALCHPLPDTPADRLY